MNGAHLWAERYDRELSDIFAIQEDITRSMVASIAPAIEDTVLASIHRALPANLTAHEIATRAWSESNAAYLSNAQAVRFRPRQGPRDPPENCSARTWYSSAHRCGAVTDGRNGLRPFVFLAR